MLHDVLKFSVKGAGTEAKIGFLIFINIFFQHKILPETQKSLRFFLGTSVLGVQDPEIVLSDRSHK